MRSARTGVCCHTCVGFFTIRNCAECSVSNERAGSIFLEMVFTFLLPSSPSPSSSYHLFLFSPHSSLSRPVFSSPCLSLYRFLLSQPPCSLLFFLSQCLLVSLSPSHFTISLFFSFPFLTSVFLGIFVQFFIAISSRKIVSILNENQWLRQ